MKVAVFGQTLYSGVMAALLAECGHQVFWCDILKRSVSEQAYTQDDAVINLLHKQEKVDFCNTAILMRFLSISMLTFLV
jgi:UDPglucose 6-dehydrogenase